MTFFNKDSVIFSTNIFHRMLKAPRKSKLKPSRSISTEKDSMQVELDKMDVETNSSGKSDDINDSEKRISQETIIVRNNTHEFYVNNSNANKIVEDTIITYFPNKRAADNIYNQLKKDSATGPMFQCAAIILWMHFKDISNPATYVYKRPRSVSEKDVILDAAEAIAFSPDGMISIRSAIKSASGEEVYKTYLEVYRTFLTMNIEQYNKDVTIDWDKDTKKPMIKDYRESHFDDVRKKLRIGKGGGWDDNEFSDFLKKYYWAVRSVSSKKNYEISLDPGDS